MADLAISLYILAITSSLPDSIESRLLVQNEAHSPIGRIWQAGLLRNSLGVPEVPMRVLGRYALVYIVAGSGRYKDASGLSQPIIAGDFLLLFPSLGHSYGPGPREHWSEIWFIFEGPLFELWEKTGLLNSSSPVHHAEPIHFWFSRLKSTLENADRSGASYSSLIEIGKFQLVLLEMLSWNNRVDSFGERWKWLGKACALLEADLAREVILEDLARQLGVSYETFRKRFAEKIGVSPARYRAERIIDKACELMYGGGLTDKEIAGRLGFCDEFHFSKRFKEIRRVSPSQFRRHLPKARRV